MALRIALVGGPMYDHIENMFAPGEVEIVVKADHPTLNRTVAAMLEAGERIDVLSTHSKYAPSQSSWLTPLDDLVSVDALAPAAIVFVGKIHTQQEKHRNECELLPGQQLLDTRLLDDGELDRMSA